MLLRVALRLQPAQFNKVIVQCGHRFTKVREITSESLAVKYEQLSNVQREDGLKLIEQVSPEKGGRVLDIGCGTGFLTNVLAERVGPRGMVVGVDPDGERLEVARRQYAGDNIQFVEESAETFPEDQYDLVFSNYVLHWVQNKDRVLQKVCHNLCCGGRFAYNTFENIPQLFLNVVELMGEERVRALFQQFSFPSVEEYVQLAISNGFSVEVLSESVLDQSVKWPSINGLFDWITATMPGHFDSSFIDEPTLEKFKQQYADKEIEVYWPRILAMLKKPGP